MPHGRGDLHDAKKPPQREAVGLPARPFLYTLDQIAQIISVELTTLNTSYVYFEGRSTGVASRDKMLARNIAPRTESPAWRVNEREFIRWMKRKGFRFYENTVATY